MSNEVRLYRWRSDALKNYRSGEILAIGSSIEQARDNARSAFETAGEAHRSWLFATWVQDGGRSYIANDPDDEDERQSFRAMLEADIAKEPEVGVAFAITGGE